MSKIKILIVSVGIIALSGCSSSNVSGEWDCPRQVGIGCITIDEADHIAVQKLKLIEKVPTELSKKIQKKEHKVWFAPYTDKSGNKHDASTVYYYEEIQAPSVINQSLIEQTHSIEGK